VLQDESSDSLCLIQRAHKDRGLDSCSRSLFRVSAEHRMPRKYISRYTSSRRSEAFKLMPPLRVELEQLIGIAGRGTRALEARDALRKRVAEIVEHYRACDADRRVLSPGSIRTALGPILATAINLDTRIRKLDPGLRSSIRAHVGVRFSHLSLGLGYEVQPLVEALRYILSAAPERLTANWPLRLAATDLYGLFHALHAYVGAGSSEAREPESGRDLHRRAREFVAAVLEDAGMVKPDLRNKPGRVDALILVLPSSKP
jgi:hypothetical protein